MGQAGGGTAMETGCRRPRAGTTTLAPLSGRPDPSSGTAGRRPRPAGTCGPACGWRTSATPPSPDPNAARSRDAVLVVADRSAVAANGIAPVGRRPRCVRPDDEVAEQRARGGVGGDSSCCEPVLTADEPAAADAVRADDPAGDRTRDRLVGDDDRLVREPVVADAHDRVPGLHGRLL